MSAEPGVRSDADLILAARADPDCFRVVYDRYAERVHGFFWRRTGDRELALDLAAETFAQAWLGKERFRDLAGGSAGPWLFTIARRLLVKTVEQRRLETKALERLRITELPHSRQPLGPELPAPHWQPAS